MPSCRCAKHIAQLIRPPLSSSAVRIYAQLALILLPLAAALTACGSDAGNPVRQALAQRQPRAELGAPVAFRFSAGRTGDTRLYVLPGLDEAAWRFRTPTLRVERVVGFSREQDQVYLLSPDSELVALDLTAGRARTVDSSVTAAVLGPTGRLHLVHRDGTVGAIEYRSVSSWPARLDSTALFSLWGAGGGRLLAAVPNDSGTGLFAATSSKPPASHQLPRGALAVSYWGDVVVVTVDSGLVQLDPFNASRGTFTRLQPPPTSVAVAPAGHRLYAAGPDGKLAEIDRFEGEVLDRLELPGPVRELRIDPLGRMLLARPAEGDSLWVVDLAELDLLATLPGPWREDLPTVAPNGTLLLIQGADLVAVSPDSFVVIGRVSGGARDLWLAAAWDPRRPSLQLVSDTAATQAVQPDQELYVQVSSTSNEAWAQDLARSLRSAGMQATVLPPSTEEDRYRVVLGPFPTREAAEAIGRKLGKPFWIFTREQRPPTP